MNNKKIIVPIIIVVLIGLLVLLSVFVIYPQFMKDNSNVDDKTQIDGKNNNENNDNTQNNTVEISLNDAKVVDLINKIDFDNLVLANIYKNGDFDRNTIPNDLILKIGFQGLDWSEDGTIQNESSNPDYPNDTRWIIPQELIEKNIKNIFGDIKYEHTMLKNNNISSDFGSESSHFSANYENKQYEIGLTFAPILKIAINQVPYKSESLNNDKKINIYVKTYYSTDACQVGDGMYIYKSYNYNDNKLDENYIFMQGVNEYGMECLKQNNIDITGIKTYDEYINTIKPEKLKEYDFFDKLDSYVYTFELSDDGNYYLYSFKKVA